MYVDAKSFVVQVPEDRVNVYLPEVGKQVIFGLRPEDVYNPEFISPGIFPQPVDVQVELVELMGNEIFVYMKNGDHNFVARVDPRSRYHMGEQTGMTFNMANMHLFDAETEKALR